MRLVLLFTYGMSLASWRRQGLIDRELSYCRHLQQAGVDRIDLFTYSPADATDRIGAEGFAVLPQPAWLGPLGYSLLGPLLRRQAFRAATIIRSNQSRGAWTGIVAKWFGCRALLVVRCGWVRTREMMTSDERLHGLRLRWAEFVERRTFASADLIFVTTAADRRYLLNTYSVPERRVQILPNAVDTSLFTPAVAAGGAAASLRVITIGRIVEMKNFHGLIRAAAIAGFPIDLVVVGDGPYRSALAGVAEETGAKVTFRNALANSALPDELRRADVFVMPQLYGAGMSKVILEAMACGLVVIASDIEAHRAVVSDGVNGFLCGTSVSDLRAALTRVQSLAASERAAIGARARQDIEAHYSMRALAAKEVACYRSVLAPAAAGLAS